MRVISQGGPQKRRGPRQVPRSPPLKHTTALAAKDERLARHLEITTVFSGFSNIIQNDLIATISDVVRYDIKEISAAPFVAAEVKESMDVTKLRSLSSCG